VDGILALVRLLLAVPFAVAGLRKLADPMAARRTLADLGVKAGLVNAAVSGLTLAELAAAVGLLWGTTAKWSAMLAVVCLAAQAIPPTIRLAREGTSAAGLSAIVRAYVLAIPATAVLWLGWWDVGPSVGTWLSDLSPARQATVAAGVVALAFVARGLPRRHTRTEPPDRRAPSLIRPAPALTIGMATYDDFDGVYFTLQALRMYHDLDDTELLVVDNYGCPHTRDLVRDWANGTYLLADDVVGTAAPKDLVFRKASGVAVLCCDSHVLFPPGVIARLKRYYREHPDCVDLLQGPLVYDDGRQVSSHFEPVWRDQMWGVWATDPRAFDPESEPFEIPMQGLGAFSCRSEAWPGFHPGFRGFGGEEGYLHEKFRRAGAQCLCLPWFRWMHRFGRPRGIPYPLTIDDKLRNYLLGHTELGLDLAPVLAHFAAYLPTERIAEITAEATGRI
jgi:hypothetical protein